MIRVCVRLRNDVDTTWGPTPEQYARQHYPEFTEALHMTREALRAVVRGTDIEFVIFGDGPFSVLVLARPADVDALRTMQEWLGSIALGAWVYMSELAETEEIV